MLARFFVFMILACSVGFLHATPCESDDVESDDALIAEIVANDNECVSGYAEERVYLKPERIIPTDAGLFLNLNNRDYVSLTKVHSDTSGCYVQCRQALTDGMISRCPNCKRKYIGTCDNKDCPGKEKVRQYEQEKKRKKQEYKQNKKEQKERVKQEKKEQKEKPKQEKQDKNKKPKQDEEDQE